MTLCIDIGNTRIRCALGTKESYVQAAVDTNTITDADGFAAFLRGKFGEDMLRLTGGIFSSVVPHKNADVLKAIALLNKDAAIKPVDIAQMDIDFSNYGSVLGQDRAVCSWVAAAKYGAPVIVIDFGTATTVNIVDEASLYAGGAIMAGVQTGIDALAHGTARLPQFDVTGNGYADVKIIGQDTYECLVSGAIIGTAFAANGYVRHIQAQFAVRPAPHPTVIITGGNAPKVLPHCDFEYIYEPTLLIEGLFMLYETTQ